MQAAHRDLREQINVEKRLRTDLENAVVSHFFFLSFFFRTLTSSLFYSAPLHFFFFQNGARVLDRLEMFFAAKAQAQEILAVARSTSLSRRTALESETEMVEREKREEEEKKRTGDGGTSKKKKFKKKNQKITYFATKASSIFHPAPPQRNRERERASDRTW